MIHLGRQRRMSRKKGRMKIFHHHLISLVAMTQSRTYLQTTEESSNEEFVEQEASPLPMTYRAKLVRKAMRERNFELESYDSSWSSATNEPKEREDADRVQPLFGYTGDDDSNSNASSNDEKISGEEEYDASAHAYARGQVHPHIERQSSSDDSIVE
jgi:hypothetical protein